MTCPGDGKRITAFAAVLVASLAAEARAAQLPLRTYTTADGLARNTVLHILQDSRGLLWIATAGGLSRFDGYSLISFPRELDLPGTHVNVTFESRSGDFYVGTDRGLCRIRAGTNVRAGCAGIPLPAGRRISVNALVEDPEGSIWVGAAPGLYRLDPRRDPPELTPATVEFAARPWGADSVESMILDRKGNLWMGTPSGGVYRRRPDGRTLRYTTRDGLPSDTVQSILEDSEGRIWIGTNGGLARLIPKQDPTGEAVERIFSVREGLPRSGVTALLETRDKTLWVGTPQGLARACAAPGGALSFRLFGKSAGLSDPFIRALMEGRDGILWVGTGAGGLVRMGASGLLRYGPADGLPEGRVLQIGETRDEALFVLTEGGLAISAGPDRFQRLPLPAGAGVVESSSAGSVSLAEDPKGGWWVGTSLGLLRYGPRHRLADLGRVPPDRVYSAGDGLPGRRIALLHVDSRGDLWVGTTGDPRAGVARWERGTGRFRSFTAADGLPAAEPAPAAIEEDPSGQVWLAFRHGGMSRWRGDRFESLPPSSGLPEGPIAALYLDRAGRLWVAMVEGIVVRLDLPAADPPRFTRVDVPPGLAGDPTLALGEDLGGRIYVGHARGVERLDPETGRPYHLTPADGLVDSEVQVIFRDRRGVLWLGTDRGLDRLDPAPNRPVPPPTVLITGYSVPGGESLSSLLGAENLPGPVLRPNQDDVTIDYVGVSPASADLLRYQTRLEGSTGGWSAPTARRTVTYSQLSPGHYRFLVRVLDPTGLPAPRTASVQLEVLRPFWQRSWFLATVGLALLTMVAAVYRRRLSRQLEMERIRTRIATDLHDDLGATLSQVAFLSEVARRAETGDRARGTLERIGVLAGQAMDAVDDIVWSVDPTKDRVASLASRLRNFAEEITAGREIDLRLSLPSPDSEGHLSDPGLRRHVLLFAKECLTNAVRHSGGTILDLSLALDPGFLTLQIQDNGKGLPESPGDGGQGLGNLRRRTESLGGTLSVESAPDRGTRVTLKVPLRSRRRRWNPFPGHSSRRMKPGPDAGGAAP